MPPSHVNDLFISEGSNGGTVASCRSPVTTPDLVPNFDRFGGGRLNCYYGGRVNISLEINDSLSTILLPDLL